MPTDITVSHLKKYYQISQKEEGLIASIKSLFHREYQDIRAVDDVSFEIDKGELVGFIGPNGAGKTTTLKVLSGLLYPTSGEVSVLGFGPFERDHRFLRQIGFVTGSKNQLWWDLPAQESFLLIKAIYEIPEGEFRKNMSDLVELLDAGDFLKTQVRKLSLGQRMKGELIAALLHQPKVLFLDEPTIGLDVVAQKKIRDFIKEYNQKFGSTIILTSHYMMDVLELCKRVIIIDSGHILYDGLLSKVVERFTKEKIIEVDFDRQTSINESELGKIGKIRELTGTHAVLTVKRPEISRRVSELLDKFSVHDLKVDELPLEEIIREIFASRKM